MLESLENCWTSSMAYRVIFEDEFQNKLKSILNFYISEYHNNDYANKIISLIYQNVVKRIETNPYLYPAVLGKKNIRKAIIIDIGYKWYYIVDEIEKIIYVFDIESFKENHIRYAK